MDLLLQMEQEEQVCVLYACEAGSRAWGLDTEDSDYDVRFIYQRPLEQYLTLFEQKEVIVHPVGARIDLHGWDLKKALQLLGKSNPTLLEWLHSPVVYKEESHAVQQLRNIALDSFSPKACFYHYYRMAKRNYEAYCREEQHERRWKTLLAVWKPLLACGWLERHGTFPPVGFKALAEEVLASMPSLLQSVLELGIRSKPSGYGYASMQAVGEMAVYIEGRLAHAEVAAESLPGVRGDMKEMLEQFFKELVLGKMK